MAEQAEAVAKAEAESELITISALLNPTNNWLTLMLVFVPLAIYFSYVGDSGMAFLTSMAAIMPLAWLMGKATEEIAVRTSESVGGLLNATFGNAAEVIIAVMALIVAYRAGADSETAETMINVVQASLIGSILGNLLLVMGLAFLWGGMNFQTQKFSQEASQTNGSLLLLALVGLAIPAAFSASGHASVSDEGLASLSRFVALILLGVYGLHLLFQLKTHANLFSAEVHDDEHSELTQRDAVILLVTATVLVAWMAEILVHSIEYAAVEFGLPHLFIGVILLPLFGNAAEHFTAVSVAGKDKMDLSIGIAIGSSIQIALLIAPLTILLSWALGLHMTLAFGTFETVTAFTAVLIANFIIQDGKSNWLEGAMLLATYAIIGLAFLFI